MKTGCDFRRISLFGEIHRWGCIINDRSAGPARLDAPGIVCHFRRSVSHRVEPLHRIEGKSYRADPASPIRFPSDVEDQGASNGAVDARSSLGPTSGFGGHATGSSQRRGRYRKTARRSDGSAPCRPVRKNKRNRRTREEVLSLSVSFVDRPDMSLQRTNPQSLFSQHTG